MLIVARLFFGNHEGKKMGKIALRQKKSESEKILLNEKIGEHEKILLNEKIGKYDSALMPKKDKTLMYDSCDFSSKNVTKGDVGHLRKGDFCLG